MTTKVRLQKVIADAGVASRREAERLIQQGLVTVNGKVVTEMGIQVEPNHCHIKVRGKLIHRPSKKVYLAIHKPAGYVTTQHDPEERPTVMDLVIGVRERVFPVGRLDYHTEGLLLLTNDGELANEIMHPRYHIPKTYRAKVKGRPDSLALQKLARGVRLAEGVTAPAEVRKVRYLPSNTTLEITIHEGRKRQIRRMLEKIGHPVLHLKRIRIGPVYLGNLARGKLRALEAWEIEGLRRASASARE